LDTGLFLLPPFGKSLGVGRDRAKEKKGGDDDDQLHKYKF
jgi:hypothetical protein